MKLKDWLQLRNMKQSAFAKKARVSPPVVNRLVNQPCPDVGAKTIRAIIAATDGEVTADDILGTKHRHVSLVAEAAQ